MQLFVQTQDEKDIKDWAIIEMQGDLESRVGDTQMSCKFIGDLHYTKEGVPVMIIGHHVLYGKVQKLDKPFIAMEKISPSDLSLGDEGGEVESRPGGYAVKAIIRKKLLFKTRPKPIIANVPKKI